MSYFFYFSFFLGKSLKISSICSSSFYCSEIIQTSIFLGVVKITPAHDPVDFEVAKRHNLNLLPVINEDGKIGAEHGEFAALKRFEARKLVLEKLKVLNLLRGIENHKMILPICTRSKDVIEYLLKPQWFIDCKKMAEKAFLAVKTGHLKIDPPNFEKNWFTWLENIR